MIRVLQVGMPSGCGGIEKYLMNYYETINTKKIQFDFLNIHDTELYYKKEIEQLGGKIYIVPNYTKKPFKYIRETVKLIKMKKYDVVHCNMNSAVYLYPIIAAKVSGAKVIISHAHNNSCEGRIKRAIHKINKQFIPVFANEFFACSVQAGKYFFSKRVVNSENFKVVKNTVDTQKFKIDSLARKKKREEFNIREETFVIGHVGGFREQKNHIFLLQIFKEVLKKRPNSKMVLIGEGKLKTQIEIEIKMLGIEEQIILLGNRNDIHDIMQIFDVFVLPSLFEGFGIVLIEAQSSGIPCITTKQIPFETQVSEMFYRVDLNGKTEDWVEQILESSKKSKRVDERVKGYDLKMCSIELEKTYEILANRRSNKKTK